MLASAGIDASTVYGDEDDDKPTSTTANNVQEDVSPVGNSDKDGSDSGSVRDFDGIHL